MTAKQARFVQEYLVDLNATQAAIRAGYSEKTAYSIGWENLRKPEIQAAITERRDEIAKNTGLTVENVIARLDEVARRCMQAEPVTDRQGRPVYTETPEGGDAVAYTFNATGANRSLELIGKHLGAFIERHEHTGPDGGPIVTKVERVIVRGA